MLPFALLMSLLTYDISHQPAVRQQFWTMLTDARWGLVEFEQAAFIVALPDGSLDFVSWPQSGKANQARWKGHFPRGTIAIAHTHPNSRPRPSALDLQTASRLGLPVYVITKDRITRTTGADETVVARGNWRP